MNHFEAQFSGGGQQNEISLLIGGFITPAALLAEKVAPVVEAENPNELVWALDFPSAADHAEKVYSLAQERGVEIVRTHSAGALALHKILDACRQKRGPKWQPKKVELYSPPQTLPKKAAQQAALSEAAAMIWRSLFGPDRSNNFHVFCANGWDLVSRPRANLKYTEEISRFSTSEFAAQCAKSGILTEVIDAQFDCFGFRNKTLSDEGFSHRVVPGANHNTFLTNPALMLRGQAVANQVAISDIAAQIDLA